MERRNFLLSAAAGGFASSPQAITVRGPLAASALGLTLAHEHLFSNFGEPPEEPGKYDEAALLAAVVPYAKSIRSLGCATIVDGTAAWFGRQPRLLRRISELTGLNILSNTGYYGAAKDQYIPPQAQQESAQQIAARWLDEFRNGIGGTGIRPGFLKLGVDPGPLSPIDRKLITAAAITHRQSGLAIAVHTGESGESAREQLAVLQSEGVSAKAWIWIHANKVTDLAALKAAAEAGAWISLDGLDNETIPRHLELAQQLKAWGRLRQVLLSHDGNSFRAGGKRPMRPYSALFTHFLPMLQNAGFAQEEIRWLTVDNPSTAYSLGNAAIR
ncbi:MAG: phosphotriesterase [Acidobacteria bacterium]|nr:phosphotriesterase [Acidobacteriota bacterium]